MIRVWDLPVRIFHWLLVILLAFSWWTGEQHEMEWHRLSGYCITALIIFRIWWGCVGSRTARFVGFLRGPRAIMNYIRSTCSHGGSPHDGHNPLGGLAVVAMMVTIGAMVVAGLFSVDIDGFESGPLADYISFDRGRAAAEVHRVIFNILLFLIALHIVAILFYLGFKRLNLVRPMITGLRPRAQGDSAQDVRWSPLLAIIGMAISIAVTWAISKGFHF